MLLKSLDPLEVVQPSIGAGGFGQVDKARIRCTGQPVAMKRIRPMEGASDNELHAVYLTLVKEFKLMCSVSHPALQMAVGLYNPQNWKAAVLVTPFCENGSLKSFMVQNGSRFNMTMKTVVILGIAVGMRELHSAHIAHRDLKPENILLNGDFRPIVSHFGVQDIDSQINTFRKQMRPNCHYLAPEVMNGQEPSQKADIYSFGILVYEIITGKLPFPNCLLFGEFQKEKQTYSVPVPPSISKLFSSLIHDCIRPPDQRPDFHSICERIVVGYNRVPRVNFSLLDTYKQELLNSEIVRYNTFNIPTQIVKSAKPGQKWDSTSPCPILFEELDRILNLEGDHPVILVMVMGHFETGKSTYLRALTGNAGFYPGKGTFSQTQGILMDGPYRISDLIDRIPGDIYGEIKDRCQRIAIPADPSIYFIDSQGVGDEHYELEQKEILERVFLNV